MGAGDEISKAAENAMEDLAGISEPSDDGHVPEPGKPGEPIKVNSSVSEGTNASETEREDRGATGSVEHDATRGGGERSAPAASENAQGSSDRAESQDSDGGLGEGAIGQATGGVAGPAGLPDPDPEDGTAEPLESDQDPSAGMGRD